MLDTVYYDKWEHKGMTYRIFRIGPRYYSTVHTVDTVFRSSLCATVLTARSLAEEWIDDQLNSTKGFDVSGLHDWLRV